VSLVAYHTLDFVAASYAVGEQSESPFGLTHRWILT
jgi:TRAP-type mannitol/chloroaromatic compound transport system permease small subunit